MTSAAVALLGVLISVQIATAQQILQLEGDTLDGSTPETVKEHLIMLSRGALRSRMGDTYSKIVETCLTCLDDDNMEFGDVQDFQDDDGVEVGSRYVRKIMENMNTIMY